MSKWGWLRDAEEVNPALATVAVLMGLIPTSSLSAQTIQYNTSFKCNGERVAIHSCSGDSDNANCMVLYPDRPLHNGFEAQLTEKRGDVMKKIQACVGPTATLAPTPKMPVAVAPTQSVSTPATPQQGEQGAEYVPPPKSNAPPPPPDASVAKARAAGVDMTVLGIPLGQALTLPPCERVSGLGVLFAQSMWVRGQPFPCADNGQFPEDQNPFGVPLDITIVMSPEQLPGWMNIGSRIYGLMRNGVLLALYMNTSGQAGDAAISKQLRAKYGNPTQETTVAFKNLFGYTAELQRISSPGTSAETWAAPRSVPAKSAIAAGSAERSF